MKPDNILSHPVNWRIWQRNLIAFGLVCCLLCIVFWPVLMDMARIWLEDTTYNHGFLIAPISLWLVYIRRSELGEINPRAHPVLALLCLAPAVVMLVGDAGSLALLQHFSFVSMLVILIVSLLGWPFAKKFWFPILFLFFMVPIGVELVPKLQYLTAEASVWLLRLSGVPVFIEGILIQLPNGLFEVAEACAGIRFLIANIVVATLFAYFCFQKKWKVFIFMVLAVLIPVGANCLRAYGIMMIAHTSNNELAVGVDHLVYGWIFFTFVMIILLWVGTLFADRQWSDPNSFQKPLNLVAPEKSLKRVVVFTSSVLALFIISVPAFNFAMDATRSKTVQSNLNYPEVLPQASQTKWKRTPLRTDVQLDRPWSPAFKTADATYRIDYMLDGKTVEVFIAWIGDQSATKEIVHFANRFDDDVIWKRGELGTTMLPKNTLSGLPSTARLDALITPYSQETGTFGKKAVVSWYWVNGTFTSSAQHAKLEQIKAALTGGPTSAGMIALASDYIDTPQEALETISIFMKSMNSAQTIFQKMEDN